MKTPAQHALEEVRQTLCDLAVYLEQVAEQSANDDQRDLEAMAAALTDLLSKRKPTSWSQSPTHAGNRLLA